MKATTSLAAFAASFSTVVNAVSQGFNYGSTFTDGTPKQQSDFENEFKTAQCLTGAPGNGFNNARLYTMVQGGTSNNPISAIPAAISTKTHLLLGLWASAGDAAFANELQALANAIATYGTAFTSLVDGISVGSEDLYRITPTGIQNGENPGAQPETIVNYISRVRNTISGTSLSGAPVGHVDTWTAWANSSNGAVVDACDWLGMDAYPYFQSTMDNSIANSKSLFDSSMAQTKAFAKGKSVWVTETGFPISGKVSNLATPSLNNAQSYWDQVGCPLFGNTNVWWYTLQDSAPSTPNPSFGLVGSTLSCTPVYDISCKNVDTSSSSSSASASASSTTTSTTTVTTGSSGTQSSASTTTEPTSLGGGSPGAGSGLGSSQLSLETSSISTASKPTGSTVSSSPTTGTGSGSGNSSVSGTGQPSPSASTVSSGAAATAGAAGVALFAVMGAVAVAL